MFWIGLLSLPMYLAMGGLFYWALDKLGTWKKDSPLVVSLTWPFILCIIVLVIPVAVVDSIFNNGKMFDRY